MEHLAAQMLALARQYRALAGDDSDFWLVIDEGDHGDAITLIITATPMEFFENLARNDDINAQN